MNKENVSNSVLLFLIFSLLGCLDKTSVEVEFVVVDHKLRSHGEVAFSAKAKNAGKKMVHIIDPAAGGVVNKVEPVSFCLARQVEEKNMLPDKFDEAMLEYKSKALILDYQFGKMNAFSSHLLKIPPKESSKFKTELYTPEVRLGSGRYQARCYYGMKDLDLKSANSREVEDFMKKMEPLELVSPPYFFEIP